MKVHSRVGVYVPSPGNMNCDLLHDLADVNCTLSFRRAHFKTLRLASAVIAAIVSIGLRAYA